MPEIEIPNPGEIKEKAEDPFAKQVALCIAVYAVVLAITALGGSNAGKDMMMAMQKATNQWAYYQAKVVRENMYLLESEKLELELELRGATLKPEERQRVESVRAKYKAKADVYAQEKQEIRHQAEEFEKERDKAARRDPYFDFSSVFLQIAIVLASVAMLSGKKWAFRGSLGLAFAGVVLTANGFLLIAKIPGLE